MEIKLIKVSQIKPYERNNKLHGEDQIKLIMKSISELGYRTPIIIDDENVIIAGHGRYEAIKRLGYKEIQCIVLSGLTEDQKNKYRLIDNISSELGEYDIEAINREFEGITDPERQKIFDFAIDDMTVDSVEESKKVDTDYYKKEDSSDINTKKLITIVLTPERHSEIISTLEDEQEKMGYSSLAETSLNIILGIGAQ